MRWNLAERVDAVLGSRRFSTDVPIHRFAGQSSWPASSRARSGLLVSSWKVWWSADTMVENTDWMKSNGTSDVEEVAHGVDEYLLGLLPLRGQRHEVGDEG